MTPEQLRRLQIIANDLGSEAKASLPNTINGITLDGPTSPSSIGEIGVTANENSVAFNKEIYDKYKKYGVILNPGNSEEELNRERAENQTRLEQFGRSLGRMIWSEAVLGTLRGFGDIYDAITTRNLFKPDYEQSDYTSKYSQFFEDAQNAANERMAIYRENPNAAWDVGDFAWWADNAVSVASTLSLMLPSKGIIGGIGLIGKSAKYATNAAKLAKAGKIAGRANSFTDVIRGIGRSNHIWDKPLRGALGANRYKKVSDAIEIGGTALLSRIGENYIEARDVYNMTLEDAKSTLKNFSLSQRAEFFKNNPEFVGKSDEEIAKYIAGESASRTYRDDFAMLLMDIAQFKSISAAWKNIPTKAAGIRLANANRKSVLNAAIAENVENAGEQAAKKLGKGIFSAERRAALKDVFKGVKVWNSIEALELGEGVEEMYQYIASEKGNEIAKQYLNPNYTDRSILSYFSDGELWVQGAWGILGGLAFQAAGRGLNKLSAKLQAATNKDLSEKQINDLLRGDNAKRYAEIEGRKEKVDRFIDNLILIQQGKNPFEKREDRFADIETAEDKERLTDMLMGQLAEELTFNAIETGNYDLFKTWIDNSSVNDYIKQKTQESGISVSADVESRLKADMESIAEAYNQNYYDILDNADVVNPYALKAAARHLTRQQRSINEIQADIERKRSTLNKMDDITDETEDDIYTQTYNHILLEIDRLRARSEGLTQLYTSGKPNEKGDVLSKDGYDANIKEINAIRRGLATYLINNTPFGENERARALFNEGKYQNVLDVFEDNFTFTDVTSKYKEQTSGLINDIAAEELHKGVLEEVIPKTKDELSDLYDDFESAMYRFADTRFNEAYDTALDYIRKSDDYEKALSDLLTDNISDRKLKEAMKMLKVGYSNRKDLSRDFMKDIERLKRKDTAEAEKVSSKEVNGETVKTETTTNEETNASQETTTTTQQTSTNQATPLKQENPDEEVADLGGDIEVEKEPTNDEENAIKAEAEAVLQRFSQIKTSDSEQARIDAGVAASEVFKEHPQLFARVLNGKSQDFDLDYSNLLNAIAAQLVKSHNMDPVLANTLAQYGLQLFLNNSYTRKAFSKREDELKNIDKLLRYIDEINTSVDWSEGWNTVDGIYDPSKIRSLSSDEYYNRFIELMRTYKELRENLYEQDGKTYINLYDIAQFILNLAEENKLNYESATQFITNLRYFAKTYTGNEFVLEGTSFINKYTESIIDDLFERFTSYEPISDIMHFDAFRTKNYNNPTKQKPLITKFKEFRSKGKQLFVQYRYKTNSDERISIDLYYLDDDGGKQELGYLDVVEDVSKGKQNSAYKRTKGVGFRFGVSLRGTSYEMTPTIDKLFKEIIAGSNPNATEQQKKFYNIFKNYFALNNPKEFDTVKYSDTYKINPNDVIEFLNSDLFLDLLENGDYGIQYSKGKKYSKSLEKEVEVYDFHTKESFSKLSNEEKQNLSSKFFNDLSNILFYQLKAYVPKGQQKSELTEADMLASYNEFVKKTFENYKATYTIQKQLDEFEKGTQDETVGLSINYVSDNASTLNYEENGEEQGIGKLHIISDIEKHPYVYVDGTTMYDERGKAYKTPAWMGSGTSGILMYEKNGTPFVAMFTGTNEVAEGNDKLKDALSEYFTKYINDYLSASGKDIERAYDNLYKMFVSLIGRQALFTGFDVVKLPSSEAFSIRVNDEITGKPRDIMTFFKYNSDLIWKKDHWENAQGQRINGAAKDAYLTHSIRININGKQKGVYGNTTEEAKQEISRVINALFYGNYAPVRGTRTRRFRGLQFNSAAIVSKYNKGRTEKGASSILSKRSGKINDYMSMKNGKLVVKIGSFEETYESYSHFLVANNAMKTTHSGRTERTVDEYITAPTSIYVDIGSVKTPVKESSKELRKGLSSYVKAHAVDGKMQMSTTDVLIASDVSIDEVNKFKQASDEIAKEEGMGFLPDSIEIDTKYETNDDGGYFSLYEDNPYAGKIVLFRNGVKLLNDKGRTEALRLLVHEQIHKVTEQKDFFKGDIGKQRIEAIDDLWNQFYKYTRTLDKTDSIRIFANSFNKYYKSADAETRAKEFVSEVMSQKHLMEVLDTIEYKGKYNIEGTNKESLLQKLLKILAKLFNGLQNLTKNSILDNIYTILGDNPSITITTKNKQGKQVKEIDTTSDTVEETNDNEPIVEKPTAVAAGADAIKDDTKDIKNNPEEQEENDNENEDEDDEDEEPKPMLGADDYDASKIRSALPVEIRIEDINEDGVNNPYGLTFTPNMESYLERFSPSDRLAMVSELTAGRINYVCQ